MDKYHRDDVVREKDRRIKELEGVSEAIKEETDLQKDSRT